MKSMSVRGLDPELEEKLKQFAQEEGKSVNQVVIEAMKKQFGLAKDRKFTKIYHDLDHLFGRWSQEEFDLMQEKIESGRKIDEELWR